jgi:hypothetical protein
MIGRHIIREYRFLFSNNHTHSFTTITQPFHDHVQQDDVHQAAQALLQSSSQYAILQPQDWLRVPLKSLEQTLGIQLKDGRLKQILKEAYPTHKWPKHSLTLPLYPGERRLLFILSLLFSKETIHQHARKSYGPGLINPHTGAILELDAWIPSLKLAFEYQDDSHYETSTQLKLVGDVLHNIQERDHMKKELMKKKGLSLVEVGYWWDGRVGSLVNTILKERSDLRDSLDPEGVHQGIPCISEQCPDDFIDGVYCSQSTTHNHWRNTNRN